MKAGAGKGDAVVTPTRDAVVTPTRDAIVTPDPGLRTSDHGLIKFMLI
jgi:hypothetical protein